MGVFDKVLTGDVVAAIGAAVVEIFRDSQKSNRRNSPLCLDGRFSQNDFNDLVAEVAQRTPRVINVVVTDLTAILHVKSNSGLSRWRAEVDFNDYGTLTGKYWLDTENSHSLIPKHFAEAVKDGLTQRLVASAD